MGIGESNKATKIDRNSRRDASHVVAGFQYQHLCSIQAWLDLEEDATLTLESGEDFQIRQGRVFTSVQIKHHAAPITLGSRHALEAIANYWNAHESDLEHPIEFVYLTSSEVGIEAGKPFGDCSGVVSWTEAILDDDACTLVRKFLIGQSKRLPSSLIEALKSESNDVIRARLLRPLHWATGSADSDEKRRMLLLRIADLVRRPITDGLVEKTLSSLLELVATVAARPRASDRRLTKSMLFEALEDASKERFTVTVNSHTVKAALESSQGFEWLLRMDQARAPNFYKLIPLGEVRYIPVDDIFVSPKYYRRIYRDGIFNADHVGKSFLDDALEILRKDRLLAIVGPFGMGKSVLAKSVLQALAKALPGTTHRYYFRAYDLLEERYDWSACIGAHDNRDSVVAVIDGLDELYLASRRVKNLEHLHRNLRAFLGHASHFAIVTSRIISTGARDDVDYFFLELSEYLPRTNDSPFQTYFSIEPFSKSQIVDWLHRYCTAWCERDESAIELNYSLLEQCHKGIGEAAKTPLFLYMLASVHYQREPLTSIPNVYGVYKEFVDMTVGGKWAGERVGGAEPLKELGYRYSEFLEALASDIHMLRARSQAANPIAQQEDWQLDSNESAWLLPKHEASKLVQDQEARVHPTSTHAHSDDVYKIVMSNYFLVSIDGKWKFRDNNVLNFFVARRIGAMLTRLAQEPESQRKFVLNELGQIPLERNVLHLVFYWLDSQEDHLRSALVDAIYALVVEKKIVQLDENALEQFGPDKLYCDVLLALIFIRLNRRGLSDIDMSYFPKRIDWLTKAGGRLGVHFQDIVRVFFQKSFFVRTEFRRLNYKGYNFTNAEIADSAFIQCRLLNAIFRGVKFSSTRFRLCDLEATSLESVKGTIEFSDCVIDDLRVIADADEAIDVKFVRCYIRLLHLGGGRIRGKIVDSVIDKLVLNPGYYDKFVVSDSICSGIEAKHAKGIIELSYGGRMKAPKVSHIDSQLRVDSVS